MTENQYFRVAEVLSPITSSLTDSALQDADPVLYRLLQYFAGVTAIHIGPRFDAEVTAMGRPDLVGQSVAQVVGYDPLPIATEDQYKFPLLAAYRIEEDYEWKSVTWYHITSKIQVLYILPPLTSDQGKRLYPLTTHFARTLVDRTLEGFEQNFNAGEQVWHEAGLEEIGMSHSSYGKFPGLKGPNKSNIWFPGVSCEIECIERRMPVPENFQDFTGFDGYISLPPDPPMDGYNSYIDFLDIKKDF